MTFHQYNEAKQHLLFVINTLAPTETDKRHAELLANTLEASGTEYNSTLVSLCGYLYDGLAYGNWPTVVSKMIRDAGDANT